MFNINKSYLTFLFGLILGSYLTFYLKSTTSDLSRSQNLQINKLMKPLKFPRELPTANTNYERWFKNQGYQRIKQQIDTLRYNNLGINKLNVSQSEAQVLQEQIKIFCVILSNKERTARAGVQTWAKGCNNVTIVKLNGGDKLKHKLPVIKVRQLKFKDSNWNKLCEMIKSLRFDVDEEKEETEKQFEWVVIVHEQTFVLMENLRWFLASLDHDKGYYLGQAESFWNVRYNSGKAGVVLSRGSVRVLREEFKRKGNGGCEVESLMLGREDFTLGTVLSRNNIFPLDTRDADGYSTFNAYNWQQEMFPGVNYYPNAIFPRKCCSSRTITFKGIEKDKFYMYQYLLYQLGVFRDGELGNRPMQAPKDGDFVWKQFLAEHGVFRNVSPEEYYDIWAKSGFSPEMFNRFDKNYD